MPNERDKTASAGPNRTSSVIDDLVAMVEHSDEEDYIDILSVSKWKDIEVLRDERSEPGMMRHTRS